MTNKVNGIIDEFMNMVTEVYLAISILYKVLELCLRYSAVFYINILNIVLLMLINKATRFDIIYVVITSFF